VSAIDLSHVTLSTPAFKDGLGERLLGFDRRSGDTLELLRVRAEFAPFEPALAERVERLAEFIDPRFAALRGLAHDPVTGRPLVVSEHLEGERLSESLARAHEFGCIPDITVALHVVLHALQALAALDKACRTAHGALGLERMIVTPQGRLILTDHALAPILQRLGFSHRYLWRDLRLAMPIKPAMARFDVGADVAQAAVVLLSLTIGRPLLDSEYPDRLDSLAEEVREIARIRGGDDMAEAIGNWLDAALPSHNGNDGYADPADARFELEHALSTDPSFIGSRQDLLDFLDQIAHPEAPTAAEEPRPARAADAAAGAPARRPDAPPAATIGGREPATGHVGAEAPAAAETELDIDALADRRPREKVVEIHVDSVAALFGRADATAPKRPAARESKTAEPEMELRRPGTEQQASAGAAPITEAERRGEPPPKVAAATTPAGPTQVAGETASYLDEIFAEAEALGRGEGLPAPVPVREGPVHRLEAAAIPQSAAPVVTAGGRVPPAESIAEPAVERAVSGAPKERVAEPILAKPAPAPAAEPAAVHPAFRRRPWPLSDTAGRPHVLPDFTEPRPTPPPSEPSVGAASGSSIAAPPPDAEPGAEPKQAKPRLIEDADLAALPEWMLNPDAVPPPLPTRPSFETLTPPPPAAPHVEAWPDTGEVPAHRTDAGAWDDSAAARHAREVVQAELAKRSTRPGLFQSYGAEPAVEAGASEAPAPRPWVRLAVAGAILLVVAGAVVLGLRWRARSATVPPQPGTVAVESTPPGSEVLVDGESSGTTPVTLTLRPGAHTLELRRGDLRRTFSLDVAAGASMTQSLHWEDIVETGGLRVTSEPPGARVLVDGQEKGQTPLELADLPVGRHTVVVRTAVGGVTNQVVINAGGTTELNVPVFSGWLAVFSPVELQIVERGRVIGTSTDGRLMVAPGRHDVELVNEELGVRAAQSIAVKPGEVASITLEPKGRVNLNAIPWAEVFVDGTRLGETPLANVSVTIGTREFVFRHPELGERRATAIVSLKETTHVNVDMNRQ
jgi:hypothetical protein